MRNKSRPAAPHRKERMPHNRSGHSYAVVSLAPIQAGRERNLENHLRSLAVSPFAELDVVHFARWAVIKRIKYPSPRLPRRRTQLKSAYLLFTATVTAADAASAAELPGSFLREIAARIPTAADDVWSHCLGCPPASDIDAFAEYLGRSLLDTSLFYVGYPDATVAQVRSALARGNHLVRFARMAQSQADHGLLQADYLGESATWGF